MEERSRPSACSSCSSAYHLLFLLSSTCSSLFFHFPPSSKLCCCCCSWSGLQIEIRRKERGEGERSAVLIIAEGQCISLSLVSSWCTLFLSCVECILLLLCYAMPTTQPNSFLVSIDCLDWGEEKSKNCATSFGMPSSGNVKHRPTV